MKQIFTNNSALFLSLLLLFNTSFAGTVSLDTSLNNSGYRIQSIDPDGAFGLSVAVQPDNKIVLGGWTLGPALYDRFAAMRLNENGTLDSSFSQDGIVITAFGVFNQVEKLLLQSDGRIILGGTRHFGQNDFAMIRYTTDGVLDSSFDGDGGAASPINGISEDFGKDMVLQNDGKIVMVGSTAIDMDAPTAIGIIRRNTNGSLDTSFNGNGILIIQFQGVNASANSVLVQNDGKIVVGGFVYNGISNSLVLMRFNSNGSLDTSFGNSGLTTTLVSGSNHTFRTLARQSDGKLLGGSQSLVVRYNSSGIIDSSFGSNGIVSTPQTVEEILVIENDLFVVGGSVGSSVGVSRYNANGTIDTNFNETGTVTANVSGSACSGSSIALRGDDRIVVGGSCTVSQVPTFAVFRFIERPTQRSSKFDFDGDGKTDVGIYRAVGGEWWWQRSSDGVVPAVQFGAATDVIAPGDFTGDGKLDHAFFRPSDGFWNVLRSEDFTYYAFPFGTAGDVPVTGDYDGDGKADAAVLGRRAAPGLSHVRATAGRRSLVLGPQAMCR